MGLRTALGVASCLADRTHTVSHADSMVHILDSGVIALDPKNFEIFSFKCLLDLMDIRISPAYMKVLSTLSFLFLAFLLIFVITSAFHIYIE